MADTVEQLGADSETFPLWEALKGGDPTLALVPVNPNPVPVATWAEYPGFKDWLVAQYGLGYTTSRIKAHLDEIRAGQDEDYVAVWPQLSRRQIDFERTELRSLWQPLRDRLSANIENVSVLAKNNRLLALARTAEELEAVMWDERNQRTGELYLIESYNKTLRQIAEEKGELGEQGGVQDNALLRLAEIMAGTMRVQGTGMQPQIIEGEWAYEEDESETASVQDQGGSVEGSGVPAEPGADPLP